MYEDGIMQADVWPKNAEIDKPKGNYAHFHSIYAVEVEEGAEEEAIVAPDCSRPAPISTL